MVERVSQFNFIANFEWAILDYIEGPLEESQIYFLPTSCQYDAVSLSQNCNLLV